MNTQDALKLLSLTEGHATPEMIKQAYRKAVMQYHPDRNPAGLEMMKLINAAYEVSKDIQEAIEIKGNGQDYGEDINAALNAIMGLGLTIEVCGAWVWVSGNTRPHRETLKNAGFLWAPKKLQWYFRPDDYKGRGHEAWSMESIREKYGSQIIKEEEQRQLTH